MADLRIVGMSTSPYTQRNRSSGRTRESLVVAFAAAVILAGCSPAGVLNALVPEDGYTLQSGLGYGSRPRQRLDIYTPESSPARNAPTVVFFYGGSWKSGEREMYRFVGEAVSRLGYVVVVPDYRLYPDVRFPAFVEDAALAVAWVHGNINRFGGDPSRLIIAGHSAGAHIAAMLLLNEQYLDAVDVPRAAVRAGIGLAGPYAFDPLKYPGTRRVFADADSPATTQPLSFVDGNEAPLLLLHGADDRTVDPMNSRRLAEAVGAAGGRADLRVYEDLGHIGIVLSLAAPFRGRDTVYEDMHRFLRSVVVDPDRAAVAGR